jgi:hypothetical protein
MSGFSAEISSPCASGSGAGATAVFLPKILESNVAIVCFSLERRTLCVGNAHAHMLSGLELTFNMDLIVRAGAAEVLLFHQNVLHGSEERGPFLEGNAIDKLEAALVPLLDQILR